MTTVRTRTTSMLRSSASPSPPPALGTQSPLATTLVVRPAASVTQRLIKLHSADGSGRISCKIETSSYHDSSHTDFHHRAEISDQDSLGRYTAKVLSLTRISLSIVRMALQWRFAPTHSFTIVRGLPLSPQHCRNCPSIAISFTSPSDRAEGLLQRFPRCCCCVLCTREFMSQGYPRSALMASAILSDAASIAKPMSCTAAMSATR